jgi:hypothetical protein
MDGEEILMACFKPVSKNSPEKSEEKHNKPWSG